MVVVVVAVVDAAPGGGLIDFGLVEFIVEAKGGIRGGWGGVGDWRREMGGGVGATVEVG